MRIGPRLSPSVFIFRRGEGRAWERGYVRAASDDTCAESGHENLSNFTELHALTLVARSYVLLRTFNGKFSREMARSVTDFGST